MTQLVTINGLPRNLRLDAWWFSADVEVDVPEPPMWSDRVKRNWQKPAAIATGLVILADWLFWGWDVGLSLALFAMVLTGLALAVQSQKTDTKDGLKAAGITLLAVLPIIEQMQFLSVLMLLIGLSAYAVWLASDRVNDWVQQVKAMLKFSFIGPFLFLIDTLEGAKTMHKNTAIKTNVGREMLAWLMPVSLGSLFLLLLMNANPFLGDLIGDFLSFDGPSPSTIVRLVFWIAMLSMIWPFLNLSAFAAKLPKNTAMADRRLKPSAVVNEKSVRNSLVLFNLMFAMQIVMDGLYLWGGAALPEGMTYASYAHRGAYPLIATALLAGGFAIMTQRFQKARLVRWLVFAFIGQNLMLTYAAIYRLQLYVDIYSLTHLRIAAFIWMGLVFVGLALIIAQMARGLPVGWLVKWNLASLIGVLYICCFVNFTGVIAGYNIAHLNSEKPSDHRYVCQLGAQALPAILEYEAASNQAFCQERYFPRFESADNWRDWGFREWRLGRYLAAQMVYD